MKCFDIFSVVLFHLQYLCTLSVGSPGYHCGHLSQTTDVSELGKRLEKAARTFLKFETLTRWKGKDEWQMFCPLKSEPDKNFLLYISTRVLQEYISILKTIETQRENEMKTLCSASLLNSCTIVFKSETNESLKLDRLNESLCEVWNNFDNSSRFQGSESFKLNIRWVKRLNVTNVITVMKDFGRCLRRDKRNCGGKVLRACWRGKGNCKR